MVWTPNVKIKVKDRESLNKITEDFVETHKDFFAKEGIFSLGLFKKSQNTKYDFIAGKTLEAEKREFLDGGYGYWVDWTLENDTTPSRLMVASDEIEKEIALV